MMSRFRQIFTRFYFATLVVMGTLVLINILTLKKQEVNYGLGTYECINDSWVDERGNPFEISGIDNYASEDGKIRLYYTIPEAGSIENSLIFRTKNVAVKVILGGEVLYETQIQEAPFLNQSPGTRWNVVRIPGEASGSVLEIEVSRAYLDGRDKIDNFYWGSEGRILLQLIKQKLFGLLVSLLILFTGGVYLLAYWVSNHRKIEKDKGLLYLGMVALVVAVWCLLETNLFQLFTRHMQQIQLLDNMMLVIGGSVLYLYLNELYGVFRSRVVQVLAGGNLLYIIIATLSQIVGGPDYHRTLNVAIANYGFISFLFICCIINEGRQREEKKERNFDYRMKMYGVAFLGLGIMGDLIRYLSTDVMDRAMLMRFGFLAFIVFFGMGNMIHMFQLIKQGYELDMVSRLAYTDGLTGVGNRTAYLEKKDELTRQDYLWEKLGIVAFDVNNLKTINDNQGHHIGDLLLLEVAELIKTGFGEIGDIYRIGGDEFIALIAGEQVEESYKAGREKFDQLVIEKNASGEHEFTISVAYAAEWCELVTAEGIAKAEEEADRKMYEKKLKMKKRKQERSHSNRQEE